MDCVNCKRKLTSWGNNCRTDNVAKLINVQHVTEEIEFGCKRKLTSWGNNCWTDNVAKLIYAQHVTETIDFGLIPGLVKPKAAKFSVPSLLDWYSALKWQFQAFTECGSSLPQSSQGLFAVLLRGRVDVIHADSVVRDLLENGFIEEMRTTWGNKEEPQALYQNILYSPYRRK